MESRCTRLDRSSGVSYTAEYAHRRERQERRYGREWGLATAELRLADLISALSQVTDLGMGQPPEDAIRSCLLATSLARRMDLGEGDLCDVYYASLLQHVGCTAPGERGSRQRNGRERGALRG